MYVISTLVMIGSHSVSVYFLCIYIVFIVQNCTLGFKNVFGGPSPHSSDNVDQLMWNHGCAFTF